MLDFYSVFRYNVARMQRYRSGHNGADSKSVWAQVHGGSNPSRCVGRKEVCGFGAQASFRYSDSSIGAGGKVLLALSGTGRTVPLAPPDAPYLNEYLAFSMDFFRRRIYNYRKRRYGVYDSQDIKRPVPPITLQHEQ